MNFNNNEFRKTTNHVSTRRLSLEKYLERILMQWGSYFLSNSNLDDDPTENDTDGKPSREKRLVNPFKQSVNKLYSMFVQSVIPLFGSFMMS